ncbi:MAG: restriction endonuclease [Endomicrobiaceae bacterium]
MDWKKYEKEIYDISKYHFPNSKIYRNIKLIGRYSQKERQVDVLIKQKIDKNEVYIVIDCKNYAKKIDIKCVESFIAMLEDLNVDKGILITNIGYSKAALKRAYNNPKHLELDICKMENFKHKLQGLIAFPYSGSNGVILMAPLGNVIDAKRTGFSLCTIYPEGYSSFVEAAKKAKEFAYVNFWHKDSKISSISELLKYQRKYIKAEKIKYIKTNILRKDSTNKIRISFLKKQKAVEITTFIEFKKFIFFCVWLLKDEYNLKRTIRKAETMIKTTIPIGIKKEV